MTMPEAAAEPAANPGRIPVCASAALVDGGRGVRFPVRTVWGEASGFVVRFRGTAYGWLNECAHVAMELDWSEGVFFDDSGLYLLCATHGAAYEPDSGRCAGGPCRGKGLRPIRIVEEHGAIHWLPDDQYQVVIPIRPASPG